MLGIGWTLARDRDQGRAYVRVVGLMDLRVP